MWGVAFMRNGGRSKRRTGKCLYTMRLRESIPSVAGGASVSFDGRSTRKQRDRPGKRDKRVEKKRLKGGHGRDARATGTETVNLGRLASNE